MEQAAQQRFYFVVHGTVQGVGFRYFTRSQARHHGVTGWCRNTNDNTVEGEAQADEGKLAQFFKELSIGPSHAKVDKIDKQEREVERGENSFSIRD